MEKLIKEGHLKRYIREIYEGLEPRQDADIIEAGVVALPESKPAINYILGSSFDNQYQSK